MSFLTRGSLALANHGGSSFDDELDELLNAAQCCSLQNRPLTQTTKEVKLTQNRQIENLDSDLT